MKTSAFNRIYAEAQHVNIQSSEFALDNGILIKAN